MEWSSSILNMNYSYFVLIWNRICFHGLVTNKSTYFQEMAWCWKLKKPLHSPKITKIHDAPTSHQANQISNTQLSTTNISGANHDNVILLDKNISSVKYHILLM